MVLTIVQLSSKEDNVDFGRATIDAVQTMLHKFGKQKVSIAQGYLEQKINDYAFLYDAVTLAKNVAFFGQEAQNLFDIGNSTELMHNRVIGQLMYEYHMLGCEVSSIPTNCLKPKRHDLNIGEVRCEVKTIQTFGEFESVRPGRGRLSPSYHSSLMKTISNDVEDTQEQVGKEGMIVLSFWSYMLNGLLEAYFDERRPLPTVPPLTPPPNTTLVLLTSNDASRNHYVTFSTHSVISSIEAILNDIQSNGVPEFQIPLVHSGIEITIGTGNIAHSTAGLFFPLGKL